MKDEACEEDDVAEEKQENSKGEVKDEEEKEENAMHNTHLIK